MRKTSITVCSNESHLQGILTLQRKNLKSALGSKEIIQEGFVTCEHDISLLDKMNSPYPHVIALDGDTVVGYTLVMLPSLREDIEVLVAMFNQIDSLHFENVSLSSSKYFTMGQVCIDKAHRSKGLFRKMYKELLKLMSPHFDYCITEIAADNIRSQKAHERLGFRTINSYKDKTSSILWNIVILKLDNSLAL